MDNIHFFNVPVPKTINSLRDFYNDYSALRSFVFYSVEKSGLLKNINKGSRILIKPNWVFQNQRETDEMCLTTHPNLVLAVLEYLLTMEPSNIIIGDSPLQSCDWGKLHSKAFLDYLSQIQRSTLIPIKILDFRNEKWEGKKKLQKSCREIEDFIEYNLGSASLLNILSLKGKKFRVGDYDSNITSKYHKLGVHKYLVTKEVIESDVIINMPKAKTHQKAGITNGLKNYVGTIGEKSYLAHHSSNLSDGGGDCYPGKNPVRRAAEKLSEISCQYKGSSIYFLLHYLSSIIWRLAPRSNYQSLSGSWYGNDTVWRMTLDIYNIIKFGTSSAELSDVSQRKMITISDAIISGQGEGPLLPMPLGLGLLAVSDNDAFLDILMASLFGFDYLKIPLLRYYSDEFTKELFHLYVDNKEITINELGNYALNASPPKGWINYIEK